MVEAVGALLWLIVTVYALTGGADFGGGVWDLLAGGDRRGSAPRRLISRAISPVWEANHVWLVIVLVVLWTAFPPAFAAIMSTLFVPLSGAAFGIILRGSGFAFREIADSLRYRRLGGALFASSSLVTPFFFGASAGAIVTGKVRASGVADALGTWTSPSALVLGALAVVAFAYLAAVYLTEEAHKYEPHLVDYFRRRAIVSGTAAGALALLALYELHRAGPRVVDRLTAGAGLPLLLSSCVLGVAVLAALVTGHVRGPRYLAAGAFATLLWGWAVAQYPELLPGSFSLQSAAAPLPSLVAESVVVGVVAVVVVPSFLILYRLSQKGLLAEEHGGEPTK